MRVHLHSRPLGTQYTSIGEKRQEKCAKPRWLPAVKRRGDKLALIFVVVVLLALPRETNSFVATRAQFVVVLLAIGPWHSKYQQMYQHIIATQYNPKPLH